MRAGNVSMSWLIEWCLYFFPRFTERYRGSLMVKECCGQVISETSFQIISEHVQLYEMYHLFSAFNKVHCTKMALTTFQQTYPKKINTLCNRTGQTLDLVWKCCCSVFTFPKHLVLTFWGLYTFAGPFALSESLMYCTHSLLYSENYMWDTCCIPHVASCLRVSLETQLLCKPAEKLSSSSWGPTAALHY